MAPSIRRHWRKAVIVVLVVAAGALVYVRATRDTVTPSTAAAERDCEPPNPAPEPLAGAPLFSTEVAYEGMDEPTTVAFNPKTEEPLIATRTGLLLHEDEDGRFEILVDLTSDTSHAPDSDRGLLGLTYDPEGEYL